MGDLSIVSVLHEAKGRRATKLWRKVGRKWVPNPFGCGKWFWLTERLIDVRQRGGYALFDLVADVSRSPHAMLIHGELHDGLDRCGLVRRTKDNPEDGGPFFRDADHDWVMFDADRLTWQGRSIPKTQEDVETQARMAWETVAPEGMAAADVCVQLSASCGFKRGRSFSAHFFVGLTRECCCASWHRWALNHCCLNPARRRGTRPLYSLDPAVHLETQPLFVAAPIIDGGPDPLERRGISRLFVLRGERTLAEPPDGVTNRLGHKIHLHAEQARLIAAGAERDRRYRERYGELSPDEESERIRDALDAIHTGVDYRDWLRIGMALHDWDPVRGKRLWDMWSAPDKRFKAKVQGVKWSSFRGKGVGLGTLFWIAQNNGWVAPRREAKMWGGHHG